MTPNGAVQLYKDVSAALPDAKLYGPDGVSNPEFFNPKEGGLPADVGTRQGDCGDAVPRPVPARWPQVLQGLLGKYGVKNPDPYAIYGYEAMRLVLDTCKKLGSDCTDRQAMIDGLFATKGRESVLGTYDIDENGDTTLTDYGVYKVDNGELVFDETVRAAQ